MPRFALLLTLLLGSSGMDLAAARSERISQQEATRQVQDFVERYEDQVERASRSLRRRLDQLRLEFAAAAVERLLVALRDLPAEAADQDRRFLAAEILRRAPDQAEALAVFSAAGEPAPYRDGAGTEPFRSTDQHLLTLVQLRCAPDWETITAACGTNLHTYQRRRRSIDAATFTTLLDVAQSAERRIRRMICETVCLYRPGDERAIAIDGAAARQRKRWSDPFDRYLMRHGLLGFDCLDQEGFATADREGWHRLPSASGWRCPGSMRSFALDLRLRIHDAALFACTDERGRGVALACHPDRIEACLVDGDQHSPAVQMILPEPDPTAERFCQLLVQGRRMQLFVDGRPIGEAQARRDLAFDRLRLDAPASPLAVCRLRYLEDDRLPSSSQVRDAHTPPPPPPAWLAERNADLQKPLDLALEDMPLREAVVHISRFSGVAIRLDASADPLADLPITLVGDGMPLEQAVAWLERLTAVERQLTADGIDLVWR